MMHQAKFFNSLLHNLPKNIMNSSFLTITGRAFLYFSKIIIYEYALLKGLFVSGLETKLSKLAPKLETKLFTIEYGVLYAS